MFGSGLRDEQQPEHVDVEVMVEVLFGDAFERRKRVHARIVDEDIESTEALDRFIDDGLRIGRLGKRRRARQRLCRRLR